MAPQDRLDALVSRTVDYRYRKRAFVFDLSHALFSSAGVDSGTHLLLSLIAEELDPGEYSRVVDLGSGVGTLGIPLAGSAGVPLLAIDRDACATAFTRRNARRNDVVVDARTALVVPDAGDEARELLVSNLPAKAGEPVLDLLVRQLVRRSALSHGRAAFVVVKPLTELLRTTLERLGARIVAERRTAGHAAVIVECSAPPEDTIEDQALPDAFLRTQAEFQGPTRRYTMKTAHNLPEFDGLSFRTALAFDLLRSTSVSGRALLYGCGQGHLAVGAAQRGVRGFSLALADRDLLALRMTERNIGADVDTRSSHVVPTVSVLADLVEPGSLNWLLIDDDPTPGSRWNEEIVELVARLLAPEGKLLVVSRSTTVSRLQKAAGGQIAQISERRMHGFRASLLRRRR
ncbi:MAG: methyltransferase [Spirochaetota bacterium]